MAFEVTLVPKDNIELGVTTKAVFTLSNVTPTIPVPGPKGDKGDTGEQGLQGIQGEKGDKGDPGAAAGLKQGTATGTDTYTVSVFGVTSYIDGDVILVRFTNGNTTTPTLNVNGLGAKTLYKNNDGALIGGDIIAGAEMLCVYNSALNGFQCIGTSPNTLLAYVTNAESTTITKGQPVYAFGAQGDRLTVKLAYNTGDSTSAQTVGIVLSSSIAANQKGFIIVQGQLDGLNVFPTSTWADGDAVYLGATAGTLTKTKPSAPNHLVYLGFVTTASNGSAGRMYVRVQNGYEMDELHDVQSNGAVNKDILYRDTTVSPNLWKPAQIPAILGYTPEAAITAGTTGQYWRGDKSWQMLDKSAVGLGNVDNTSDATKNAASVTLTNKTISGSNNTFSNIAQSSVTNLTTDLAAKLNANQKGIAGGVAELDTNGLVPSAQLPSYVDDVLVYANFAALPATGESGKIYITENTNLTYRWSGSAYVEISASLALGTTASTAFRGDWGNTAYLHSQELGNPHGTTKSDIGLGNVDNTSDANKPVSTATQTALNAKVNANADITGATKTKITFDRKGLVTDGTDATTDDIADSLNKRYVTDAQLAVLGNTSGTNTGDETNATIKTKLGAATSSVDGYLTAANWSTFNGKQNALGFTPEDVANKENVTINTSTTKYPTVNLLKTGLDTKEPTITAGTTSQYYRGDKSWQTLDKSAVGLGSVENTALSTWAGSSNLTTLGTVGTGTWNATTIGVNKGGTGLTALGTANQLLRVNAGANALEFWTPNFLTANQTITLTGDVTGSGTTSITTSIAAGSIVLADMANLAANSIIGNNTGSAATPIALTATQTTAMLDTFTSTLKGLAPASGGGTTNFLRADGTWAAPAGGGSTYTFSTGLTEISGTVTANLSVGINNGQSVIGGARASENLTLSSTSNATKGVIIFGTSRYDEANNRLGIQQLTPTSKIHLNHNQAGVTQSDANGVLLANSTAAASGTQAISPGIVWQGNGWASSGTPNSQDVRFRMDVLPVQGSTNPTGTFRIASSINSATYINTLQLGTAGTLQILDGGGISTFILQTDRLFVGRRITTNGQLAASNGDGGTYFYSTTTNGSTVVPKLFLGDLVSTAGVLGAAIDLTQGLVFWQVPSGGSIRRTAFASIAGVSTSSTAFSEAGDLVFSTQSGGTVASEKFRISGGGNFTFVDNGNFIFGTTNGTKIGTATNQKLAFWNKTPIVQPTTTIAAATLVGGGGTTITDTDTFGGYTLAKVVQALINIGILA